VKHMTNLKAARVALAALSLMAAVAAGAAAAPAFKAGLFDPPRQAPDFSLQGTDGHELRMSRYRGKVVLLDFWSYV